MPRNFIIELWLAFLTIFVIKPTVQCKFSVINSVTLGNLYTCSIENFTQISDLKGTHAKRKNDKLVKFVEIKFLNAAEIPAEIGWKFEALTEIVIRGGNLEKLTPETLRKFPNLKVISIENSKKFVELPDEHLFINNNKLIKIFFKNLSLEVIDHRIFTNLHLLQLVELPDNSCIDDEFKREDFESMQRQLGENCLEVDTSFCYENDNKVMNEKQCSCVVKKPGNRFITSIYGCKTKNVEKLRILEYDGKSFPSDKFDFKSHFKNVRSLTISQGKIEELHSKDLSGLQNLEYLDLSKNQISRLDSNVFEFNQKLKTIKLSNNKISSIGVMTFTHLKQLLTVDLSENHKCTKGNSFTSDELNLLETLKIFDSCKARDSLEGCVFLQDVFTFIGTADACLAFNVNFTLSNQRKLGMLEIFDFFNKPNPIDVLVIRDQICNYLPDLHLHNLKGLIIRNSNLMTLKPENFKGIPNLITLDVSDNQLTFIDFKIFEKTQEITEINFSNNHLSVMKSQEILDLLMIKNIMFDENICIQEDDDGEIQNYAKVLAECSFVELHCHYTEPDTCVVTNENTAEDRVNLKKVIVDRNSYSHKSFIRLEIRDKKFYYFPNHLGVFFPSVEVLFVVGVHLRKLENKDLVGFKNLKELNVVNNDLMSLDSSLFEGNLNLISIDFSGNNFESVATDLLRFFTTPFKFRFISTSCVEDATDENIEGDQNLQTYWSSVTAGCNPGLPSNADNKNCTTINVPKPFDAFTSNDEVKEKRQEIIEKWKSLQDKQQKKIYFISHLLMKYKNEGEIKQEVEKASDKIIWSYNDCNESRN